MIDMVRKHEIQVASRRAKPGRDRQTGGWASRKAAFSAPSPVTSFDSEAARAKRRIGRRSKAEPFRDLLTRELVAQPDGFAVELLLRAKNSGYEGGKSASYELVRKPRP